MFISLVLTGSTFDSFGIFFCVFLVRFDSFDFFVFLFFWFARGGIVAGRFFCLSWFSSNGYYMKKSPRKTTAVGGVGHAERVSTFS